jgi:hypothetical protein
MRSIRQVHHRYERSPGLPASTFAPPLALTLRVATAEDLPRIAQLAALDSSRRPEPPVLIAELDAEICVAVSLTDLKTVADPFRLTAHAQAITLARAQQLRNPAPARGRGLRRFGARHRTANPSPQPQRAT